MEELWSGVSSFCRPAHSVGSSGHEGFTDDRGTTGVSEKTIKFWARQGSWTPPEQAYRRNTLLLSLTVEGKRDYGGRGWDGVQKNGWPHNGG